MIKILMEVRGSQTETHCSLTSSIGACEKLSTETERCLLFKRKLKYDWDTHSYKRIDECLGCERND